MENIGVGFAVETKVSGIVAAIKPYNENANKKGAQLQFARVSSRGLETIDVKIEAAREEDLQKFRGQSVIIKDVQITKIDFNTFYSCPDKSLVTIINKKD